MWIDWDDAKRHTNVEAHGLDFPQILHFRWSTAIFRPTYAGKHGNARFKTTGFLHGDLVTAVFGGLGSEGLSLISLRRASRSERREYEQARTPTNS
jgi:uncharacterized DUF497 family protein